MTARKGSPTRGDRLRPSRTSRVYWHLTKLRQAYEAAIAAHIAGGRHGVLVDYGCGNLPYRPLFEPHCGQYLAADLAGNADASLTIAADGSVPLESATVEIVLSSQVLEHVLDPGVYLAEAVRVLQPGGLLVLSTHGVWHFHPDPTDHWRWTSDGLRRVVEQAGFEVIHWQGIMGPPATAVQLWQDATQHVVPHLLRPLYFGLHQLIMAAADAVRPQAARDRDACVYLVVARKRSA